MWSAAATVRARQLARVPPEVRSAARGCAHRSGVVNDEALIEIDSLADAVKRDMTAEISVQTAQRQALGVSSAATERTAGRAPGQLFEQQFQNR